MGKIRPNAASADTGVTVAGKMMPTRTSKKDWKSRTITSIAASSAAGIVGVKAS
jgi:hypothetical protein